MSDLEVHAALMRLHPMITSLWTPGEVGVRNHVCFAYLLTYAVGPMNSDEPYPTLFERTVTALGFLHSTELCEFNDAQEVVDPILERIDTALKRLITEAAYSEHQPRKKSGLTPTKPLRVQLIRKINSAIDSIRLHSSNDAHVDPRLVEAQMNEGDYRLEATQPYTGVRVDQTYKSFRAALDGLHDHGMLDGWRSSVATVTRISDGVILWDTTHEAVPCVKQSHE